MREWRRTKTTWGEGERKQRNIPYRLECTEWDRILSLYISVPHFIFVHSPSFPAVCPETETVLQYGHPRIFQVSVSANGCSRPPFLMHFSSRAEPATALFPFLESPPIVLMNSSISSQDAIKGNTRTKTTTLAQKQDRVQSRWHHGIQSPAFE